MKSWQEKFLVYGTHVLVFLVPFLYMGTSRYLSFATSKTFFFYGAVEIIFAVWLYQTIIDVSYRFSKKEWLFFAPLFLYVGWLTIAGLVGVDPQASLWSSFGRGTGLLTLYHIVLLTLVVASFIKKFGLIQYGHKLISWFVGGTFILTTSVWLGNEGFNLPVRVLEGSKGGGLMGNSSLAGAVLVFGLFFAIFLLFSKEQKRNQKIFLWATIAFIVFSPLFLNVVKGFGTISARGAAISILVGAVSSIFFYLALSKKKALRYGGLVCLIVGIIGSVFVWNRAQQSESTLHQTFINSAGENRFLFWEVAKDTLHTNPFFGVGPENFRVAYQTNFDPHMYELNTSVEVWADRAHNIFYDLAVSGGWPAMLLYVVLLGSIVHGVYMAHKRGIISQTSAAFLCSLVVAYVVQNLFVFDSIVSLIAFSLLIGLVIGMNTTQESQKQPKQSISMLPAVLIAIVLIPAWIYFAYMPAQKAKAFTRVIELPLNERPLEYETLLRGSPVGNSFDVGAIADDSYKLYNPQQKAIKADVKLLPYALIDLEKIIGYLEEVAKDNPQDYRLHISIARLYNTYMYLSDTMDDQDFVKKALAIEHHATKLAPSDPQIYWTQGLTEYRSGDKASAQATVKKAIEIAPYIDFSHQLLEEFSK